MNLTIEEAWLFALYHSGSVTETAAVIREALPDITERSELAAAGSLLRKLEGGVTTEDLSSESGWRDA